MGYRSTIISEFPLTEGGSSHGSGRGWYLLTALLGLILALSVSIPSFAAPSAPNLRFTPVSLPESFQTKLPTVRLLSDPHSDLFSRNARDLDDCHPGGYRSGSQTLITCHHGSARLHAAQDQWPFLSSDTRPVPVGLRNRWHRSPSGFKTFARSVPTPPPIRS